MGKRHLAWLAVGMAAGLSAWMVLPAGERGAGRLQPAAWAATPAEPERQTGQEESDAPEVIDLTPRPPAIVDSDEPPLADLPLLPSPDVSAPEPMRPTLVVTEFLPHSADGDETPRPMPKVPTPLWRKVAAVIWGIPPGDGRGTPVKPTACPYAGGKEYAASEEQDAARVKPTFPAKTPPARPGDLPPGWFVWPR
ncbi:MAG: hypothetical protein ACJ8F7_17155 [Gemmataceae bacterium]